MKNRFQLAEVLGRYVSRAGYTPGQLSRLSGVPQATITNWLEGRVKKPHHWDTLLQVAEALHLTEMEATELLQAAGHPAIEELMVLARDETEKTLLAPWAKNIQRREQAPFQAIADLPYFVGREKALQELKEALLGGQRVAICGLQGMGGVGKTVLAAHAAYLFRPYFPDGVLWARVDKADTMSVLSAFANAYERDVSQYTDVESRGQVVRELLAHKRALMVLDNAQASEEVRPLLPPTGTCAVIITTRRHDLTVIQGVQRLHLGEFDRDKGESLALFTKLLGEAWVRREKAALSEIAELLGHLPLAVTIAASRLAYEPGWSATDLLRRLRQEKKRLGELVYEDQDVRVSFDLSYKTLSPKLQHFFTSLGVFGGEDFSVEAVAYVTKLSLEVAHDNLRKLHSLSLVQQGRLGRYRLHPLLHDFALEKIDGAKSFFERMIDYFVQYVDTHTRDYSAIELERGNILAMLQTANDLRRFTALISGINTLYPYLEAQGLYDVADLNLRRAQGAAKSLAQYVDLANILRNRAEVARHHGDYKGAESLALKGLALAREIEYYEGVCKLLRTLGVVALLCGEYARGNTYLQEGLSLARKLKDSEIICSLLVDLGVAAGIQGDYILAEMYFKEGLAHAARAEIDERMGALLGNLGILAARRENFADAERYYKEGLALARKMGHHERICSLLADLAVVVGRNGDYIQAEEYLREALMLASQLGEQYLICGVLAKQGNLYLTQQKFDLAGQTFQKTHDLAEKAGLQELAANALFGLAQTAAAQANHLEARRLGQRSLALFRAIEHGDAAIIEQWLTHLPLPHQN